MKVILICIIVFMVLSITSCKILDSVRNPANEARAEEIIALKEKVENAIENKTLSIKEGMAMLREIDDLKKDVAGSDNILYTILGILANTGILLLRHKLPGIKKT